MTQRVRVAIGGGQAKKEGEECVVEREELRRYYHTLAEAWGPQHWWPAHTRFEIIVGAYLTQNTAWVNVERALVNLRSARVLSLSGIRRIPLSKLERLIRSSGYFRQKARRLKTFVKFVDENYGKSLDRMFLQPPERLREELLSLNGVGPETADSILLYAGNYPVFVVDAYTRRILERHGIAKQTSPYEELRQLFENALASIVDPEPLKPAGTRPPLESGFRGAAHSPSPMSSARRSPLTQIFNEMHGLVVGVGKHFCRKSQPLCDECPLRPFLPTAK